MAEAAAGLSAAGAVGPTVNELYPADAHRLLRVTGVRCEEWLRARRFRVPGYAPETVARRLTQKILAEITTPFRRELKARVARGDPPESVLEDDRLAVGEVRLSPARGAVSMRPRALARWSAIFLAYWFYLLLAALAPRLRASDVRGTLLHGVGAEHLNRGGSDASLLDFARHGPVTPLREAERLFIQAVVPPAATDPGRVRYGRYPLVALLRARGLSIGEFAHFFVLHLRALASFVCAVFRTPAACLLARDFAFDAAARILNRSGSLAALVLTGSNFLEQMLWMTDLPGRGFRTHMLFYSVNGLSFVYKAHPVLEHNTILAYMRVDEFWVWTDAQARVVREWVPGATCRVAGPMLLYRPGVPATAPRDALRIAVFDITPLDDALTERWGVIRPYYTTATGLAFLRDIVAARDAAARAIGRPIELLVKPKRTYQRVHSTAYVDALFEHERSAGHFRVLDADTDLLELIGSSDLVITLPYSSPPYLAAPLGIASIYYDASHELLPSYDPHPLIAFAGDAEALKKHMVEALRAALRSNRQLAASG